MHPSSTPLDIPLKVAVGMRGMIEKMAERAMQHVIATSHNFLLDSRHWRSATFSYISDLQVAQPDQYYNLLDDLEAIHGIVTICYLSKGSLEQTMVFLYKDFSNAIHELMPSLPNELIMVILRTASSPRISRLLNLVIESMIDHYREFSNVGSSILPGP